GRRLTTATRPKTSAKKPGDAGIHLKDPVFVGLRNQNANTKASPSGEPNHTPKTPRGEAQDPTALGPGAGRDEPPVERPRVLDARRALRDGGANASHWCRRARGHPPDGAADRARRAG